MLAGRVSQEVKSAVNDLATISAPMAAPPAAQAGQASVLKHYQEPSLIMYDSQHTFDDGQALVGYNTKPTYEYSFKVVNEQQTSTIPVAKPSLWPARAGTHNPSFHIIPIVKLKLGKCKNCSTILDLTHFMSGHTGSTKMMLQCGFCQSSLHEDNTCRLNARQTDKLNRHNH
eukprot:1268925-Rhodomonas_salina.2